MTGQKLIQSARDAHQRKLEERVADPKADLLGEILLFSPDDSLTMMALAIARTGNLAQYLRDLRRGLEVKIEMEGMVASVHTADVFTAVVTPESQAEFEEIAKSDPCAIETAEKRGLVRKQEAIVTTAESAWATFEISTPYERKHGRIVAGASREAVNARIPRTPFTGFRWAKVQ